MARYSSSADSGSMCSAWTTPPRPPSCEGRPVAIRPSAYGSGSTSNIRAMPWRPSTSHSTTLVLADAGPSARAAATVDFPVPPLPVTMCRRTWGKARLVTRRSLVRAKVKLSPSPGRPDQRRLPSRPGGSTMDWTRLAVDGRVTALQRGICAGVTAGGSAFVARLTLPHDEPTTYDDLLVDSFGVLGVASGAAT